jgi:multidrug transporter EmrE-like cation transporter
VFALLPLIGGLLLGWFASRRTAIVVQIVFYAVAVLVLTLSAPSHDASYADTLWVAPALALLSAGTLLLGVRLRRRADGRSKAQVL